MAEGNLCFEKDAKWLDVLKQNKMKEAEQMLSSRDEEESRRLLHGRFQVSREVSREVSRGVSLTFHQRNSEATLPWTIAATHGADDMLDLLFNHGVDPATMDGKQNVIHLMAGRCALGGHLEDRLLVTFGKLSDLIGDDQMAELLKQKNEEGYRPIEWCLLNNAYGLYSAILNTPLYVVKTEQMGSYVVRWYDVDSYEKHFNRSDLTGNIFYALAFVETRTLSSEKTRGLFGSAFVQTYLRKKMQTNAVWLALWFFWRLFLSLFLMTYLICGDHVLHHSFTRNNISNISGPPCQSWLIPSNFSKTFLNLFSIISTLILMIAFFLIDCAEECYTLFKLISNKTFRSFSGKNYAIQYSSNVFVQFFIDLYFILIIVNDLLSYSGHGAIFSSGGRQTVMLLLGIQSTFSLLGFMVLSNKLSWIPVTVQRTMLDIVSFGMLFVLSTPSVAVPVMLLSVWFGGGSNLLTFGQAVHSALMAILGQQDFGSFEPGANISAAIFVLVMAVVSIIVVTLITAVFTNSVAHVADNISVLTVINQIVFLTVAERKLGRRPGLSKLNDILLRKYYESVDGRLCIQTVTPDQ